MVWKSGVCLKGIRKDEPICVTGNSKLLFVLKLLKTYSDVVDSFSSERKLRNSGE